MLNKVKKVAIKPVKRVSKIKEVSYIKYVSDNLDYDEVTQESLVDLLDECEFQLTEWAEDDREFRIKYINVAHNTTKVKSKIEKHLAFEAYVFYNCCGCIEIGGLSKDVLEHNDMDTLFQYIFNVNKETIIITTIQSQKNWEEYLKKSKYFTPVKSFKANTSNTITMWVSNN